MATESKPTRLALAYRMAGVKVNGLAGLYVYFMLLATAWMEDGGCAAWLVPSEFMDVNYGAALKRYLTDRVTLVRAHRHARNDRRTSSNGDGSTVGHFFRIQPGAA